MSASKIIYSINIDDLQRVSEEVFDKKLSNKEVQIIEDKIGDYIGWYDAIETVISEHLIK